MHPTNPNVVGFAAFTCFVSDDGGGIWTPLAGEWQSPDQDGTFTEWKLTSWHFHRDGHAVLFAPDAGAPDRVFVATDGGVFHAQNWRDPKGFTSLHNRGLRTLQFYSPAEQRNFLGSVGSTPATRGLVAGGLQDNGNVWKADNVHGTWRPSEAGDGGFNLPLGENRYLHQNLNLDPKDPDGAVSVRVWSATSGTLSAGGPLAHVPLRKPDGEELAKYLETPIEPVRQPAFRNARGQLLHAVGWKGRTVFGLFGGDDASDLSWQALRDLDPGETAFTAASFDGSEIVLSTSQPAAAGGVTWRLRRLDTASGGLQTMPVTGVAANEGARRIVATGPGRAFAAFRPVAAPAPPPLPPTPMARRNGNGWEDMRPPPPDPLATGRCIAFGMDADDVDPDNPPLLMVALESTVWGSRDEGRSWEDVSLWPSSGLPRQPHCSDLRFNRAKRRWILGTYGRSLWQAGKLRQVGVSSLLQGDFPRGAEHRNFEALVLLGSELFHYWKDNGDVRNRWRRSADPLTTKATAPACIIRSDYPKPSGPPELHHFNFEALVLEGNELWHWYRDNQADGRWIKVGPDPVTDRATGPASMIQGSYRSDEDHGNFEALIPMADGLWHWFRDGATGRWHQVARVTQIPGSVGCITLSDYENDPGEWAFEALVFEPHQTGRTGVLSHFFWKRAAGRWEQTRMLTDVALGPASLIQGDYVKGADHRNLEALVWMAEGNRSVLKHWFRRDDIGSVDWVEGVTVSDRAAGPASLIQSDFRSDEDHGNFEAIFVEHDNEVWHSYRDQSNLAWGGAGTVT